MLTHKCHLNRCLKIFLLGYHGKRNFGDDIICITLIKTLRQLLSTKVSFYVYTKENYIRQNFSEEENKQIYFVSSIGDILRALISSHIVIVDGGDHLHDYGNFIKTFKVFVIFLMLAIFTKILFKKLLIINNGFRATRSISLAFLKIILNLACCVSVRDSNSFSLISNYIHKRSQLGFDTAILLNYSREPIVNLDNKGVSNISVGFSITPVFSNFFLKPGKDDNLAEVIAKDLNKVFLNMKNIDLYFLAFNTDPKVGDLAIIRKIIKMLNANVLERSKLIAYSGNIIEFISKFSQLDVAVCCKYHSIVLSYLFEKPMVIIDYHPKNAALAREIGLPSYCIISLDEIFTGKLSSILLQLLDIPEKFKAKAPIYEAKRRALEGILKCLIWAIRCSC
jgi:polysaccharide pyruvyl transferase WcaK-like protein